MSFARPILQSNRQVDIVAAVGQVVFAFPLPLFDPADLAVSIQVGPLGLFQPLTNGFGVVASAGATSGTVTFDAAPRTLASQTIVIRLTGRRIQSRLSNVTRGGVLNSTALEDETDRQDIILQELRRDVDDAQTAAAQALQLAIGIAPPPGVSLWQIRKALAARGEMTAIAQAISALPIGDVSAVAWASRDTVLFPGDPFLGFLAATLGDTSVATTSRLVLAGSFVLPSGPAADTYRAGLAAVGLYGTVERAIPADPNDPINIEWFAGATVPNNGYVAAAAVAAVANDPIALLALMQASVGIVFGVGTPVVSLRQARSALGTLGVIQAVDAAIAVLPGVEVSLGGQVSLTSAALASVQWLAGLELGFGDPLTGVIATATGWSSQQLTAFFLFAAGIEFS